uniref:Enterochelin esterase N-terminal domain-containing protein n=1 Tax=Thermosporothrix sp. COM3 TaxID=2490863 RepID=A0A455SJY2_9CHLR|nr:hypothetical protein KTC_23720 [Thermosporothrix sp. COM3]
MSTQALLLSPRLMRLQQELEAGNQDALAAFWQEREQAGGPLIEPLEGDAAQMLVTFLWRDVDGQTRNVVVLGGPALPGAFAENQLHRLPFTDLWYRTYCVPADLRTTYQFSLNDPLTPCREIQDVLIRMMHARTDPLNPRQMRSPLGLPGKQDFMQVSILELPAAPVQHWVLPQKGVPRGAVKLSMFPAQRLQRTYHVAVYTPPVESTEPPGLLLLFDGWMYLNYMSVPTVMDNLIHAGKIAPYMVVLLSHMDYGTRRQELLCHYPFLDFLREEFVPWIRENYRVSSDPARAIVGGVSAGGVAAAFTGLHAPDLFSNVLSQSGTFWSSSGGDVQREGEWLTAEYERREPVALRFSLEIGRFDRYVLIDPVAATRRFRDVLQRQGYAVDYAEFNGGHDFVCWRYSFVERFLALAQCGEEKGANG